MENKDFFEKYEDLFEGLDKEKVIRYYYEFQNFFGDKINEYLDLTHGYDSWFLKSVILPEREKYMQQTILNLVKHPGPIDQNIISKASFLTKMKLDDYYNSHSEKENKSFNYVANGMYFLDNYKSHLESFSSKIWDVDHYLNKLLDNDELLSELITELNSIAANDKIFSSIDVFEENRSLLRAFVKNKPRFYIFILFALNSLKFHISSLFKVR